MKKRGFIRGLDLDLKFGLKGLKISLSILLILLSLLFLLLIFENGFARIFEILFRKLEDTDYLILFAGGILFIAVPFLLGIRAGLSLKNKK